MNFKKILSLILAVIMMLAAFAACGEDKDPADTGASTTTAAPVDNTPEYTYKRVIVIGVDGMGAFPAKTDTPNLDRIFAEGASTYTAQTAFPSISAQSWGSLLIGSSAYAHGLNNSIVETTPYENDALPTIFKRVRDAMPDALLASYCHWNPINVGIIEDDIDVVKTSNSDDVLHEEVAEYLKNNDPTLFYTHFDSPDGAGHGNGYGSEKHLEQVTTVDGYIGKVYDALDEAGKLEDTLFIVTTDHGGTPGGSHGGTTEAEMNIFFGAVGKTVKKGSTIGEMNIRDTAAIVLYALGIEIPEFDIDGFSSQIPEGIFEGYTVPERQPIDGGDSTFKTLATPAADSGKYINDFIAEDKIVSAFHFNDNTTAALGNVASTDTDTPKYYGTGYFDTCIELGTQGSVAMPGAIPADSSFTISLWFEHNRATESNVVLFASHKYNESWEKGISAIYNGNTVSFYVGNGKSRHDFNIPLSEMLPNGWVNLIFVYDNEEGTITSYLNFADSKTEKLSKKFSAMDFSNSENFVFGNDTAKYNSTNIMLDELVTFNTALSADEVAKLAEYYSFSK